MDVRQVAGVASAADDVQGLVTDPLVNALPISAIYTTDQKTLCELLRGSIHHLFVEKGLQSFDAKQVVTLEFGIALYLLLLRLQTGVLRHGDPRSDVFIPC